MSAVSAAPSTEQRLLDATLACLAPGRVILGAGTGESLNEVVVGMDWPEQSERFARFIGL